LNLGVIGNLLWSSQSDQIRRQRQQSEGGESRRTGPLGDAGGGVELPHQDSIRTPLAIHPYNDMIHQTYLLARTMTPDDFSLNVDPYFLSY
jgi:hypothetical protein